MDITIATRVMKATMLHSFVENGGALKFDNFNVGIAISGEGEYRELKLIVVPQNEKFTGKIVVKTTKKPQKRLGVVEDDEEEL